MTLVRKFVRGVSFSIGGGIVARAGGLVISLLLARCLGPEHLGVYAIFLSAASSVLGFTLLGLPHAIHRYVSSELNSDPKTLGEIITTGFLLTLGSHILGAFALFVLSSWVARHFFFNQQIAVWIKVASIQAFLS